MKIVLRLYLKGWLFQEMDVLLPGNRKNVCFETNVNYRERILMKEVERFKAMYFRQLQNADTSWDLIAIHISKVRCEDITEAEMEEFNKHIEERKKESEIIQT